MLSYMIRIKEIKCVIEKTSLNFDYLKDIGLKWEVIKMKIRSFTIPYASKKRKEQSLFKDKLENRQQEILPDTDKDNNESVRLKKNMPSSNQNCNILPVKKLQLQ